MGRLCGRMVAGALVAFIAVASAGIAAGFSRSSGAQGEPDPASPPQAIVTMPDVINTDVDRTGRLLTSSGYRVLVKRPEVFVVPKGREAKRALPEIVRPFRPSEWSHMIAGQAPAAGTPLQAGMEITLSAGIHHGAGPYRPWVDAHGGAVKRRGDQRCRDCHTGDYCADCHRIAKPDPAR